MTNQEQMALLASDAVARRVRKLLALAQSPNVHEAEAAAAKAAELLRRHGLDRADVEAQALADEVEVRPFDYAATVSEWQRDLGYVVARSSSCRAIHTSRGKDTGGRSWLHFVGRHEDIEGALSLFEYLRRELRRLARESYLARVTGRMAVGAVASPVAWREDFFNGAVFGIDGRLLARQRALAGRHAVAGALVRDTGDAIERKSARSSRGSVRPP